VDEGLTPASTADVYRATKASHAAAHAVVAEALELPVTLLTLSPSETRHDASCAILVPAARTDDLRRRLAVQAIAGNASESVSGWVGRQWWRSGGPDDRDAFRLLVASLPPGLDRPETLWRMARLLVRWQRRTIERVAAELLARDTLDGDGVRALIPWAPR
jgi:hypothetical protein